MNKPTLKELHKKYPFLDELEETMDKYYSSSGEEQHTMDACDDSEHTFGNQYRIEVFWCLDNEFKPSKDCGCCDTVEDYVCFQCELNQLDDYDRWDYQYKKEKNRGVIDE